MVGNAVYHAWSSKGYVKEDFDVVLHLKRLKLIVKSKKLKLDKNLLNTYHMEYIVQLFFILRPGQDPKGCGMAHLFRSPRTPAKQSLLGHLCVL